MQRVCFQLQVKPDRLAEYRERHAAVWPDMLEALHASGWRNYSLFVRPDGLLVGYVEVTTTIEDAQAAMAATEVNARWQAEMGEFFVDLDGAAPDTGFLQLEEVFHLEDQLAAATSSTTGTSAPGTTAPSPTDHSDSAAAASRRTEGDPA
ncbi:L-rhamnose mutarotase [Nocardioides sp. ChNu-153]|uniref:L-rhamnose mutarotase n=1 Tax=Nocardioides sp. ChNu-153 TaxID=2779364 RepID=UPI00264CA2E2|nr:L-rhamnose mutarotase [Nocardioides sp. ChNu-153]MDN7122422.1 L-rhamnose mutarotase [Nocardioides sp. ChNu-153]